MAENVVYLVRFWRHIGNLWNAHVFMKFGSLARDRAGNIPHHQHPKPQPQMPYFFWPKVPLKRYLKNVWAAFLVRLISLGFINICKTFRAM